MKIQKGNKDKPSSGEQGKIAAPEAGDLVAGLDAIIRRIKQIIQDEPVIAGELTGPFQATKNLRRKIIWRIEDEEQTWNARADSWRDISTAPKDGSVSADVNQLLRDLATLPVDALMDENAPRSAVMNVTGILRHMQSRASELLPAPPNTQEGDEHES